GHLMDLCGVLEISHLADIHTDAPDEDREPPCDMGVGAASGRAHDLSQLQRGGFLPKYAGVRGDRAGGGPDHADRARRRAVRGLRAGPVPLLAATRRFTSSRGAIAAGIVGFVVYLAIARPRALVSGLIAVVPATTVATVAAYRADLLATLHPTTPAAVSQGH